MLIRARPPTHDHTAAKPAIVLDDETANAGSVVEVVDKSPS